MLKRPKRGESEDDLLQFQQEFLASGGASSVTFSRTSDTGSSGVGGGDDNMAPAITRDIVKLDDDTPVVSGDSAPPPKKSRFKASQEVKAKKKQSTVPDTVLGLDPEEFVYAKDTHMAAVLTRIIERDTRNTMIKLPRLTGVAFPAAHQYDGGEQGNESGQKKKSLFARQFEQSPSDFGVTFEQRESPGQRSIESEEITQGAAGSTMLTGRGLSASFAREEAEKIHKENMTKITSMSEDQIMEEQRQLLEMMDPKLVEFLKSRKNEVKPKTAEKTAATSSPKFKETLRKKHAKLGIDIDVPVISENTWIHMDKVEYDKLEWMKDLPPPATGDNRTGQQARFDFKGNLILNDDDIPVNVGLHHHGNEPERAGYTLEELFQLARSSNLQQRVLALQTLSRIIQQAKMGSLEDLIQTPILPSILDAGVVFLFRWALDDSVDSVVAAAVMAINALLVNSADEASLDKVANWYQGHVTPAHRPQPLDVSPGIKLPDVKDEKQEETDADMSRRDLVQALVMRMSFLPRLKYILDVGRPQAPTILHILQILIRVARHSTQMSYEILNYKGLLELIIREFLPLSWKHGDKSLAVSSLYGMPVASAMRLIRSLCQAGKNMAAILLSEFQIKDRLMRYLVDSNSDSSLVAGVEVSSLQWESLMTWRSCLLYGLADTLYLDVYPILVEQLKNCQSVLDGTAVDRQRLAAVIAVLEAVVSVAAAKPTTAVFTDSVVVAQEDAGPTIKWSHVANLIQPIRLILTSVMTDIGERYQFKKYDLQVPIACINFIATFYTKWQETTHDSAETVMVLEEIEKVYASCMKQWQTFGFQLILRGLSKHSNLLATETRKTEVSSCLPELGGSSVKEEEFLPVVKTTSPIGFLSSFLRLIYNLSKVHKGLLEERLISESVDISPRMILKDDDIRIYIRKVAAGRPGFISKNYFTKFENQFLFYFLKLATLPSYSDFLQTQDTTVPHLMALTLLTSLHHGDEHLAHDLLSTVIFNQMFWKSSTDTTASESLSDLSLSDLTPTHLHSATDQEVSFTREQLCDLARSRLTAVRATYLATLAHSEKDVLLSRQRHQMNTMATTTLLTSNIGECLLPLDWIFFPLIDLYNTFLSVGSDVQNALSANQVNSVCDVLSWIYLLECHRSRLVEPVSVTLKISRIMCTFLTGNDMFLDHTVNRFLAGLLQQYTRPALLEKLDFEENVPGLPSFYDLYTSLLQQFEAVSFGDALFACYIMVPLQRRHSIQYRKAIWTEYTGVLRILSVPLDQLLIPVQHYLDPDETDVELVRLYYQSLLGVTVRPLWAPVLYLIAVHHVNRFVYTQDGRHTKLKASMIKQMLKSKNQELRQHLLYYKMADTSQKFGMSLYTELPPLRQKLVESIGAS